MKKIILVLFLLQLLAIKTFAGDTDEYFAYTDEAKVFTATVESVTKENVQVKVIHKIKGNVNENEILKLLFFQYNSKDREKPKAGENCFIAFVEGKEIFSIKTTSTDPKTLKFINMLTNADMDMPGESVIERIEQNVNNGRYEEAEKRRISKMSKLGTNLEVTATKNASQNTNNNPVWKVSLALGMSAIAIAIITFILKRKLKKV